MRYFSLNLYAHTGWSKNWVSVFGPPCTVPGRVLHTSFGSRRLSMTTIVNQSTRGTNILDQIFVNYTIYDAVKVVTPTVRSDHRAVIAYTGTPPCQLNKTRERRIFRRCSPTQHALFLEYAPAVIFDIQDGASVQSNFDVVHHA